MPDLGDYAAPLETCPELAGLTNTAMREIAVLLTRLSKPMPTARGDDSFVPSTGYRIDDTGAILAAPFFMTRNPVPTLSLLETRVLGTLYEKQHTVPDSYPLTLNALVSGCNQKTSRSPVMEASEAEVQAAIDSLKSANLVIESSGGRVSRYAQIQRVRKPPPGGSQVCRCPRILL